MKKNEHARSSLSIALLFQTRNGDHLRLGHPDTKAAAASGYMWPLDGWPGASAPIARPEIMQRPDMQRVTSLPELSLHRRQPPSTTAPPASKTKRFQQSGGAGTPQMRRMGAPAQLSDEQRRAKELISVRPREAARAPGRTSLAAQTPPAVHEGFASPIVGLESVRGQVFDTPVVLEK